MSDRVGKQMSCACLDVELAPGLVQQVLCAPHQLEKARPRPIEDKLRTLERAEAISPMGDWTVTQRALAKSLGLANIKLREPCSVCGNRIVVRNAKNRKPLCATHYKEQRRVYIAKKVRELREKRATL